MDAPARTKPVLAQYVFFLRLVFALFILTASVAVTRAATVATPVFSPVAGTYTSAQSVTITTTTSGATIRYTTDGSTPSATAGTVYAGPISISATTTLKAIAYETGFTNSAVKSGTYSIKTIAPVFSPVAGTYTSAQSVTITSATSGASINYTTDGTTPSETNGAGYSGPVSISANTTLKAIAYETGLADSSVTSGTYSIKVIAPVFSPVAGTYTSPQMVTMTSATSGASFAYTTDGTTPTESGGTVTNGMLYSGPVAISTNTTLKAIAYEAGLTDSSVTSGTYTIKVIAPVFSPAAGTYTGSQSVTITSATSGATINYTTDGSTPSPTAGNLYSGPLTLSSTTTLKAIAYETGLTSSSVTSGTYTIKAAAPVFSPVAGTYTSAQTVTITSATSGATINYTTDGTTPSATAGNLYSGPLTLGSTTTLKAIAYETGLANSSVASGTYTINLPTVATPVFSSVAGTYTSVQAVKITSTTNGASIRYTTDGSTPSATAGTIYSGPVSISTTTTLKAIAYETGFKNSAVKIGIYTINLPTVAAPVFSPPAGNYASAQSVTITSTTSGASIRYTTDGSTPTETTGNLYSGPLTLSSTATLTAIAYKANFNDSTVTNGTYTITPPPAITSPLTATGQVGAAFSYQITASNNPASYNATGLDPGLSVDTSTGLITGTPTTAGTANITISASNSGGTGSATLVLTVNPEPVTFTISPVSFTYNGGVQGPTITLSVAGATYSTSGTASATAAGNYSFTATATGNYTGSTAVSWTIAQAMPVVSWTTPSPIVYGTALDSTQLNATANVPGTFAYMPNVSTVLDAGAQTLSVLFTPTDITDYSNASASVLLTVNAEPVTFTVSPVSFTYDGSAQGPVITPSISGATFSISGTASATSAGSYTLTATATGNYTGTSGSIDWTIAKATPVVSWATPAPIIYGTALDSTELNATANVPGTLAYTPSAGTVLDVGTQTLSATFTPTDTTDYTNASASVSLTLNPEPVTFTISPASFTYNGSAQGPTITPSISGATYSTSGTASATSAGSYTVTATATGNYTGTSGPIAWTIAQATPVVSWATPSSIVYGTALDSTQLNATANVPGTFVYTPAAGTILDAGAQTLAVTFTPTDTTNYNTASASVSLTVNPAPVTFTVSPVSFTYNGNAQGPTITPSVAGATYSTSGTTSATSAGSYTVTATATGNYTGTSGPIAWTITQATPVVSWATPAPITYGTALDSTELNATANVPGTFAYTPTVGTVPNVGTQTLSVAFTPADTTNYTNASASVSLTVNPATTAAPVFSPAAGTFTSVQTVTITSVTSGASIRYTTDGSTPTETVGTPYSGPVNIGSTTTVKAIAYETSFIDSAVTSGTYTIPLSTPVFAPLAGTYTAAQSVSITSTGATNIYYTTDGSTPTTTSTPYTAAVTVSNNTVLKAIGVNGSGSGLVASASYTIIPPAPVFSPTPGTYPNFTVLPVTISDATSGTIIHYTTDGSTPTTTSTQYSAAVSLPVATTTLKAIAVNANGSSAVTAGTYLLAPQVVAPVFSPAAGNTVAITSATGGVTIRYTTDGSTPTETNGTIYSGPVSISPPTTLRAIAYETGFLDSSVTSVTIGLPTITITTPANGSTIGN
jgi:hypothetical protein